MNYFEKLYPSILYIFKIHLLGLFILTLLNFIFLFSNYEQIEEIDNQPIREAFYIGIHFDNLVVSIISFVALIGALLFALSNKLQNIFRYLYNSYYIVVYTIIIAFTVSDIPYYQYFLKHLDISIRTWMQNSGNETYSMLYTESSYYKYYFLFVVVLSVFTLLVLLFARQWKKYADKKSGKSYQIAVSCLFIILCAFGISRTYNGEALTMKTAYFCPHSFVNELSINPTYYFIRSIVRASYEEEDMSNIVSYENAINVVKEAFIADSFNDNISPISRNIKKDENEEEKKANVVIVIMESMSSYFLTEKPEFTPNLNQLKDKSYYFKNIYSTATHTNQGVFSTLYGLPALFDKNIMDNRGINWNNQVNEHLPLCEGLPLVLKAKGYKSNFFIAHAKSFDNMDVFFSKNGYNSNELFSSENYPPNRYVNTWGVDDEFLFRYAIDKFNSYKEPFLGSIMTISNHPPFNNHQKFTHITTDPVEQAVCYADHAIKIFLEQAVQQKWYNNTIFVFIGDHGRILGKASPYTMSLNANHVPMLIYSPMFEDDAKTIEKWGSQIDVFPTIMGLLNTDYENNSLGIDLMKEDRGYTVFSSDIKLGCINDDFLYCYERMSKQEFLYKHKNNSSENMSGKYPHIFNQMRVQAASTVQVTEHLLKHRLTRKK